MTIVPQRKPATDAARLAQQQRPPDAAKVDATKVDAAGADTTKVDATKADAPRLEGERAAVAAATQRGARARATVNEQSLSKALSSLLPSGLQGTAGAALTATARGVAAAQGFIDTVRRAVTPDPGTPPMPSPDAVTPGTATPPTRAGEPPVFRAGDALPDSATVAVLDTFAPPENGGTAHGAHVSQVLADAGGAEAENIARVEGFPREPVDQNLSFQDRIATGAAASLDAQTRSLEAIRNNPGNIRVINQSSGVAEGNDVRAQLARAQNDEQRPALLRELGLPEGAPQHDVEQAIVDQVHAAYQDPRLVEAERAHDNAVAQLEQQGITHVVAASNYGRLIEDAEANGITLPDSFADNRSAAPSSITVGASNSANANDGLWAGTSRSGRVDVVMDGHEVPGANGELVSGTSFAAPMVAALVDDLVSINPALSTQQIREILAKSATDTAAAANMEGAGVVNADRARELARETVGQ